MTDLPRDRLYVYDLDDELVNSLELVEFEGQEDVEYTPEPTAVEKEDDLAKFNKTRSAQGMPPLTEEQFDNMVETGSIGSISGSEDEEEDDDLLMNQLYQRFSETTVSEVEHESLNTAHLKSRTPMIYFKSSKLPQDKNLGVYKALFNEKELSSPLLALKGWNLDKSNGKSALFMLGGGHFAGAIISHKRKNIKGNAINHKISVQEQEVELIKSKTFHRYTTRKKQGGSQSANDNAKGNAKSVGSNIRRYMEQQLIQEIRELLELWKDDLKDCESIYIRANGSAGRKTLVGYEGAVISNDDKRVKGFPFSTRRATASELKRAWTQLAYMTVTDIVKQDEKLRQKLLLQQENLKKSQQQKKIVKQEVPESDKHTSELIGLCKRQKAPLLINYLKKHLLSPNMELTPETFISTPTLLHYCSSQGLAHMVQVLLVNLKADPCISNHAGRVAAELSANKHIKSMFQICRYKLGEDYCDWLAAKVGEPKTKEQVDSEEQQEAEEIRKEKQQQIQESYNNKTEMELKKPTFSSKGQLGGATLLSSTSGLNDEQKMRLMREQRARAAEARLGRLQK